MAKPGSLVFVRYRDHVLYHRGDPTAMKPETRETIGWLVYDCADYIIVTWDRGAGSPTLKGGDPKASGMVLLRSDILEMKRIASAKQGPESNSGTLKPLFRQNRAT